GSSAHPDGEHELERRHRSERGIAALEPHALQIVATADPRAEIDGAVEGRARLQARPDLRDPDAAGALSVLREPAARSAHSDGHTSERHGLETDHGETADGVRRSAVAEPDQGRGHG